MYVVWIHVKSCLLFHHISQRRSLHLLLQQLLLWLLQLLQVLVLLLLHGSSVSERGAASVLVFVEKGHSAKGFAACFAAIFLDVRMRLKMRPQVAAVGEGTRTLSTLERLLA